MERKDEFPVFVELSCQVKEEYDKKNGGRIQVARNKSRYSHSYSVVCKFLKGRDDDYCDRMNRTCPYSKPK